VKTRNMMILVVVLAGAIAAIAAAPVTLDQLIQRNALASIIVVDGDSTYVAEGPPGALATSAAWRAKRIAVSGNTTIISWADGDADFDNTPGAAGAGLPGLTYE